MDPFLWDNYTLQEVNEKVRYWVDMWELLIENLNDPSLGLVFMNPHLLVRHIIDEIVFNNFQNPENRAYFKRQLEYFTEADPATKKLFATDLSLIRREFGGLRLSYLLQLCRNVDIAYSKSNYIDELFVLLRTQLRNATWNPGNEEMIRTISECMIVELVLIGYSLESIRAFPANTFDRSTGFAFHRMSTSSIKQNDFIEDGIMNVAAYREAIKTEVDNLTVEDRLDTFAQCFHPKKNECYFIYQIEGLKGETLDFTVANVNFYSPKMKRYIKSVPGYTNELSDSSDELFGTEVETCFVNAAVRLHEFDAASSEQYAVEQIERSLDLFRTFVSAELPFKVAANKYIRVSLNGEFWGNGERGIGDYDQKHKHFLSLDLGILSSQFTENFLDSASEKLFGDKLLDSAGLRLAHSLHWFRKAEETQTSEDRLLNYWIVLENMVSVQKSDRNVLLPEKEKESKFALIREIVPPLEACIYLSSAASNLYHLLRTLLSTRTNGRPHLVLPDILLQEADLAAPRGSSIDMTKFLSQLGAVARAIPRKVIKDEVLRVQKLYSDTSWAKSDIDNRLRVMKEELLMLYRLRNRIVHNAHYDNSILPLWIEKARRYAGNTLRKVLDDLFEGREPDIESSLLRYHVGLSRVQQKLEKAVAVDFLKWKF